jgi:hypothetical protein
MRIYDISVRATDGAGNMNEAQCKVIVVPENHKRKLAERNGAAFHADTYADDPSKQSSSSNTSYGNTHTISKGKRNLVRSASDKGKMKLKDIHIDTFDLSARILSSTQRYDFAQAGAVHLTWDSQVVIAGLPEEQLPLFRT